MSRIAEVLATGFKRYYAVAIGMGLFALIGYGWSVNAYTITTAARLTIALAVAVIVVYGWQLLRAYRRLQASRRARKAGR